MNTIYKGPSFTYADKCKINQAVPITGGVTMTGDLSSVGYINGKKSGVYAYMASATNTNITAINTFQFVNGMFNNPVIENFTLVPVPGIQYDGTLMQCFEIDWYATVLASQNSTTVEFGIAKNNVSIPGSEMCVYCKQAAEKFTVGGTCVTSLSTNDVIQLVIRADKTGDVTVQHFTTTIREFFD